MVDPTAAATELDTVHHEVVVVGHSETGVGSEDGDIVGAAWRCEGVVSGDEGLVGVVGWRHGGEEREVGDPKGGKTTERGKVGGFDTSIVESEA